MSLGGGGLLGTVEPLGVVVLLGVVLLPGSHGAPATVASRCIRFARARTGPRAVAALDAATVVTCAARRGPLSSSTSTDSENPPSVLGSVKFFQILVA